MINTKIEGNIGEQLAKQYLEKLGYKILATNYIAKGGEIDIIAKDKEIIVFLEVKNRNSRNYGESIEAITPVKVTRIVKSAKQYIHAKKLYSRQIRFDIIAINDNVIEHIIDAFWAN